MTPKEIETFLASAYSMADYELLFQRAADNQKIFNTLWEMVKKGPDKKTWRFLWIMDHATEKQNDFILPILDEVYMMVLKTNNESVVRHTMKLILRCPVNEEYAGELLDRCSSWMNNPKSKISSQVLGMEFFYRTCQLYPEMAPELITLIDDLLERSPSAGFKSKLKKIRNEFK